MIKLFKCTNKILIFFPINGSDLISSVAPKPESIIGQNHCRKGQLQQKRLAMNVAIHHDNMFFSFFDLDHLNYFPLLLTN